MEDVKIIFVLSNGLENESQASELMLQAFEACQQNEMKTSWVRETEIHKRTLTKKDFVVFDNFDDKDFERILEAKSASIVGPLCILVCLMEGKKIPNFQWPIYNVAMYDCVVTTSHLARSVKTNICNLVQKMGGFYADNLTENTTHLIADSVKSAKYMKAIEMNIKVMVPSWIEAVWKASQQANVHCNDEQFERYKCPPLHKLVICSTGIPTAREREEVEKMVTENGGEYNGKLVLKKTDFLICSGVEGAMSVKYKEARKTGTITCVTLQWLRDSIEKGFCVPHDDYVVKKTTSTPQKNDYINPDFSTMSAIDHSKLEKTSIDDTVVRKNSFESKCNFSTPSSGVKRKVFTECDNLIEQIDVKKVKRCGQFLDGCSVYLVGFKDDLREKLCKIINASGASRCDEISDRITHVLVGDPECHELKLIKSRGLTCNIVTLQWLLDSIERKRPCVEESYLVSNLREESHFKSPLGKKGLSLLRSNRTITEIDLSLSQREKENLEELIDNEAEREIMKQYMMPDPSFEEYSLTSILKKANYEDGGRAGDVPTSQNTNAEDERSTGLSQPLQIFRGITFYLLNFDDEGASEIQDHISGGLGSITSNLSEADYVIAPCFVTEALSSNRDITVNDLWIYESIVEEELLPIKYYHRPLLIANPSSLEDCVVTISGYSGYERSFLSSLIVMLGGVAQEQFCRVTCPKRKILGSTHLVTADASGKKYAGALKWGLPAVHKGWLIECARSAAKVSEDGYLVAKNGPRNDIDKTEDNAGVSLESLRITANSSDPSKFSMKELPETSVRPVPEDGASSSRVDVSGGKTCAVQNPKESSRIGLEEQSTTVKEGMFSDWTFEGVGTPDVPTNFKKDLESDDSFTIPHPRRLSVRQRSSKTPRSGDQFKTPERPDDDVICSQVTPVNQIMSAVRMTDLLGTPESPQLPKLPWDVDTPETPYGLCFTPNPSKSLKKELLRFINRFPDKTTPVAKRRLSTPLSELKRRLLEKIGSAQYETQSQEQQDAEKEEEETKKIEDLPEDSEEDSTQSALVRTKLQELENIMAAATNSANKSRKFRREREVLPEPGEVQSNVFNAAECQAKESQPCTVQWDYGKDTQEEPPPKIFMISGVVDPDKRAQLMSSLQDLGGRVSETSSYDPSATHLLCPKPARNEKTLSCMSAGKWILHVDYVDACAKAGKFLNEEDFEFGNPNSMGRIPIELDRDVELRMQAVYHWRNEVARTGRRPFQDMRALIVAEKKQALVSVVEAGGGTVIEVSPPFEEIIHATHCLLEPKSVQSYSDYEPLAKQGIYCVNTVYLSDFLHRKSGDIEDSILPFYQKYFR